MVLLRKKKLKQRKRQKSKMARYKHPNRKQKLIKAHRTTRWAPVFAILKKFGPGKKVHPSQISRKRHWRRDSLKI